MSVNKDIVLFCDKTIALMKF